MTTMARTVSTFPLKVYHKLASESGNMVFSPHSISSALSILMLGCRGDSKNELMTLLGGDESFHEKNAQIAKILRKEEGEVELNSASRLFIGVGYGLVQSYVADCRKYYNSEVGELDFQGDPGASVRYINEWIEQHTNGKIRNLVSESQINNFTRIILVNATYFRGEWDKPFEEYMTRKDDFHISESNTTKVDMMTQREEFNYGLDEDLGAKFLDLDYQDRNVSMVIVLPLDRFGLKQVEEKLTMEHLENVDMNYRDVKVNLPKFRIDYDCGLNEVLKSLGVSTVFSAKANLKGISENSNLFVSAIMHKAFIEVDEKGTEAAAVTEAVMEDGFPSVPPEQPVEFICDHPFLFMIRHTSSNTILFAGRYIGQGV